MCRSEVGMSYQSEEARQVFTELLQDPANKLCCDCGSNNPQWASVSYGNYFCLECSGVHRSLGVHLSFVRSLTMDTWNAKQLKVMQVGGNAKFNSFMKSHGLHKAGIREKYDSDPAEDYREIIKDLLEGGSGKPKSHSSRKSSSRRSGSSSSKSANRQQSFGSNSSSSYGNSGGGGNDYNAGGYQSGAINDAATGGALKIESGAYSTGKMVGLGNPNFQNRPAQNSGGDDLIEGATQALSGLWGSLTGAAQKVTQKVNDPNTWDKLQQQTSSLGSNAWGYLEKAKTQISTIADQNEPSLSDLIRERQGSGGAQSGADSYQGGYQSRSSAHDRPGGASGLDDLLGKRDDDGWDDWGEPVKQTKSKSASSGSGLVVEHRSGGGGSSSGNLTGDPDALEDWLNDDPTPKSASKKSSTSSRRSKKKDDDDDWGW